MRKLLPLGYALAMALLPTRALGSVASPTITTARISTSSPAHYVFFKVDTIATTATQALARFVYPFAGGGKLVNVIVHQYSAGIGGTSVSISVRNAATTGILATAAVTTLASGGAIGTDSIGALTLPSGWTRPVLGTAAASTFAYGAYFDILATETGTYSTHPQFIVTLVFEPLQ